MRFNKVIEKMKSIFAPNRCGYDGDDLTGALRVLQLQLSHPSPLSLAVAPIKSRMETFWYRLAQVHLRKMAVKMDKDRETVCCVASDRSVN